MIYVGKVVRVLLCQNAGVSTSCVNMDQMNAYHKASLNMCFLFYDIAPVRSNCGYCLDFDRQITSTITFVLRHA